MVPCLTLISLRSTEKKSISKQTHSRPYSSIIQTQQLNLAALLSWKIHHQFQCHSIGQFTARRIRTRLRLATNRLITVLVPSKAKLRATKLLSLKCSSVLIMRSLTLSTQISLLKMFLFQRWDHHQRVWSNSTLKISPSQARSPCQPMSVATLNSSRSQSCTSTCVAKVTAAKSLLSHQSLSLRGTLSLTMNTDALSNSKRWPTELSSTNWDLKARTDLSILTLELGASVWMSNLTVLSKVKSQLSLLI